MAIQTYVFSIPNVVILYYTTGSESVDRQHYMNRKNPLKLCNGNYSDNLLIIIIAIIDIIINVISHYCYRRMSNSFIGRNTKFKINKNIFNLFNFKIKM